MTAIHTFDASLQPGGSPGKSGGFMTYIKAGLEAQLVCISGVKHPWVRSDSNAVNLKNSLVRLPAVYVLYPESQTKVGPRVWSASAPITKHTFK